MLLLLLRLGLALVFAFAAFAKLADRHGTREALSAFGVREPLVPGASIALPLVELSVAALLIPSATAIAGAAAATALLAVFTLGVAHALRRGERPDCNCFGALQAAPIGWQTLARNCVLIAIAVGVAIGGPGESATSWVNSPLAIVTLALGCVAVALTLVLWLLLRRHGEVLAELDRMSAPPVGLDAGSPAPSFVLPSVADELVSLEDLLRPGLPAILIFADPACGPCASLFPDIGRWQREHSERRTVAVISSGERELSLAHAEENGIATMLLQDEREVATEYGLRATPSAVVVAPDGHVAAAPSVGAEAIRDLLVETLIEPELEVVLSG